MSYDIWLHSGFIDHIWISALRSTAIFPSRRQRGRRERSQGTLYLVLYTVFEQLLWFRLGFGGVVQLQPLDACESCQLPGHIVMAHRVPALLQGHSAIGQNMLEGLSFSSLGAMRDRHTPSPPPTLPDWLIMVGAHTWSVLRSRRGAIFHMSFHITETCWAPCHAIHLQGLLLRLMRNLLE